MKRFWRQVAIDAEGVVRLDDRPVRTPGRVPLALPTAALAAAVADEWRAVDGELDPRDMPLTGLSNAAIDRVAPDPRAFAAGLAAYGASDLTCYRAADPPELVARQAELWDPPLAWARSRYDVHFELARGVMPVEQPAATLARLGEAIAARDPFELAGLSPVVTITGSLVLALSLIEGALSSEQVWTAAHVDEDWQIELWGQDDLARVARDLKKREYDAAVRFLSLL